MIAPLGKNKSMDEKYLLLSGWQFYDVTSPRVFWATHCYQMLWFVYGCCLVVAHESMFAGLALHICAQAILIKYRLKNLVKLKEKEQHKQLTMIVRQHIAIYRQEKQDISCYFVFLIVSNEKRK